SVESHIAPASGRVACGGCHVTKLSDTSPEIAAMLVDIYRRMPIDQRWTQLRQNYRQARVIHAAGVRMRHPAASDADVLAAWIREQLHLPLHGLPLPERNGWPVVDRSASQVVPGTSRTLGIVSALGGSLASSFYGAYRHTNDADVSVEPFPGKEQQLVAALNPPYYVELAPVCQA